VRIQSLMALGGGQGGLAPALGTSLALHLLLLWPAALPGPAEQAGTTLSATLRAPAVVAAQTPVPAVSTQPAAPAGRSAAAARPAVTAARDTSQAADAVLPPLTFPAGEPAQVSVASAAAVANGEAAAAVQDGVDADGVRAYRIGLAREARAFRRYPQLARERGWSGTAEIQVGISREGMARQIHLARSSGHEVLDQEAISMMSRAAQAAALPESLRGRAFVVHLPVVFDLAESR